jgi:hypothetical protein
MVHGALNIQPLANGDSVVYPPVIASTTEAIEDHYLVSGYAAATIDATNNPFVTIEEDLVQHFGRTQGNDNVAVWINSAQSAKVRAIAAFDEVPDRFVNPGVVPAVPVNLPAGMPGRVIGRLSGCWVLEWDWMPATYMFGLLLDQPKPLIERVDTPDSGLGSGLQLVAQTSYAPLEGAHYSHRFGFGCGNRLNGVAMFVDAGGAYTVPSAYTERP